MTINESNYVELAQKAIKELSEQKNPRTGKTEPMVTTSKIRNLLSMTADIYNEVMQYQTDDLSEELIGRIEYLRVRFIYECGREKKVKEFVEKANLLKIMTEIKGSRKNYILFNRYMEALVAFHKYYGGKD